MLTDKKKVKIFEKLYATIPIEMLLNCLFKVLDGMIKITAKCVYIKEGENLISYKIDFPDDLKNYETIYSNLTIQLANYKRLEQCVYKKEVVILNKNKADDYNAFTQVGFKLLNVDNVIYIPICKDDMDTIGVLAIYNNLDTLNELKIKEIKEAASVFYNVLKDSIDYHQAVEGNKIISVVRDRYKKILKLSTHINRLAVTNVLFKMLVDELNLVFGFELGFIQLQKDDKLPIVDGSAVDAEKKKIFEKIIKHFGDIKYAPLIHGPNGPEMANCICFINNTHVYFKDFSLMKKNIPMLEKDKLALEIASVDLRTILLIPIVDIDKPIGILQLWSFSDIVDLTEADIDMIKSLASFIPSIIRNSELHTEVDKQKKMLEEKNALIKAKNDQIFEELKIAKRIQANLIPKIPQIEGLEIASMYKPMEAIGGDLYDYIYFEEDNLLGVFVSDVSGHGVPAALLSSMVKTLVNTAGKSRISPVNFLTYINEKIIEQMSGNFLTAFYALFDINAKTLRYARAGHSLQYFIRGNNVTELDGKGSLLGIFDEVSFEEKELSLKSGDRFLFYTDGLIEATDARGVPFEDSLLRFLRSGAYSTQQEEIDQIFFQLINHCENIKLDDDVCIISIKVK